MPWRAALVAAFVVLFVLAGYDYRGPIYLKALKLKRIGLDAVPCPKQTARTLVIVPFGQSNAANSGEQRHRAKANVLNFVGGHCLPAEDPLIGADGTHGSVWGYMGERLDADYIIIAPAAVGATTIADWNGGLLDLVRERVAALHASGYTVTHFLWHQGEADAGKTAGQVYGAELTKIIAATRELEPPAAVLIAVASACTHAADADIQAAQRASIDPARKVYAGPNFDELQGVNRRDGCHFSRAGQQRAGAMWADAIKRVSN